MNQLYPPKAHKAFWLICTLTTGLLCLVPNHIFASDGLGDGIPYLATGTATEVAIKSYDNCDVINSRNIRSFVVHSNNSGFTSGGSFKMASVAEITSPCSEETGQIIERTSQLIAIEDILMLSISCPPDVIINCDENSQPSMVGTVAPDTNYYKQPTRPFNSQLG